MAKSYMPMWLYLHFPWCVRECPYCDFNSHRAFDAPRDRYTDALISDIEAESARADGRPLQSVFMGGGTPSYFGAEHTGRILRKPAHPASYIETMERGGRPVTAEAVSAADAAFEFMLNGLRLPAGFSEDRFMRRTELPFGAVSEVVRDGVDAGLLETTGCDGWRPTALGLRHLNELQARFLV